MLREGRLPGVLLPGTRAGLSGSVCPSTLGTGAPAGGGMLSSPPAVRPMARLLFSRPEGPLLSSRHLAQRPPRAAWEPGGDGSRGLGSLPACPHPAPESTPGLPGSPGTDPPCSSPAPCTPGHFPVCLCSVPCTPPCPPLQYLTLSSLLSTVRALAPGSAAETVQGPDRGQTGRCRSSGLLCPAGEPQPVTWGWAHRRSQPWRRVGGRGLPAALTAALPGGGSGQDTSLPHRPRRPDRALNSMLSSDYANHK